MCKIPRNSEKGNLISSIKLHPDFKSRQAELPHRCQLFKITIGRVITPSEGILELNACRVCGMPQDKDGEKSVFCGPTGHVQKALLNGETARVELNECGRKLGFIEGTFDSRYIPALSQGV
ncbi:hypothetical protein C4546_00695 [Candidatus Parcubacteria bacterium]|jgi:hypothetical protein|nr:MAG: hypothetical protein C4546_00695 [Candidatus Parcubacteria bacterium]